MKLILLNFNEFMAEDVIRFIRGFLPDTEIHAYENDVIDFNHSTDDIILVYAQNPKLEAAQSFKFIKSIFCNAQICLLSGVSNDVDDVRASFLAGFTDYLIYPFGKSSVHQLRALMNSQFAMSKRSAEIKNDKESEFMYKSLLRYFCCKEPASSSNIQQWINYTNLCTYGSFCTVICKIDLPLETILKNDYESINNTHINILVQYMEEELMLANEAFNVIQVEIENNLCILFYVTSSNTKLNIEGITVFLSHVQKRFTAHTSYGFTAGISLIYDRISCTDAAYKNALTASSFSFYKNSDGFFIYDSNEFYFSNTLPDTSAFQEELRNAVEKANMELVIQSYKNLGDVIKASNVKPSIVKKFFLSIFNNTIYEAIIITDEAKCHLDECYDLIPISLQLNTLDKTTAFYSDLTVQLLQISSQNRGKAIKLIADAKKYIHENYSGYITLKSVASHIHINPNYLCELFKKYANINFAQYLMQYRINKAKKLLLDTDKKIVEIAQNVGYEEIVSFNRVFKKMEGITPTEFRKIKFKDS